MLFKNRHPLVFIATGLSWLGAAAAAALISLGYPEEAKIFGYTVFFANFVPFLGGGAICAVLIVLGVSFETLPFLVVWTVISLALAPFFWWWVEAGWKKHFEQKIEGEIRRRSETSSDP